MNAKSWVPIFGEFESSADELLFKGSRPTATEAGSVAAAIALSNLRFGTGIVRAQITFDQVNVNSVAELLLWYDPVTRNMLTAGIGGGGFMCAIRVFNQTSLSGSKWSYLNSSGTSANLRAGRAYELAVDIVGSRVTLLVDSVRALATNLSAPLPESQVGVFCLGEANCHISNFRVDATKPRAFVVMEYSKDFNELYEEVVKPAVESLGLDVKRADETYGPGLILSDITGKLLDARVVIAEITPPNPNVYFEVGYSFAIGKPPILLAVEGTELPFDVSPFRTLFYENTIKGKKAVEDGLKSHVRAVLGIQPHEVVG